jgi:hypothetical protein
MQVAKTIAERVRAAQLGILADRKEQKDQRKKEEGKVLSQHNYIRLSAVTTDCFFSGVDRLLNAHTEPILLASFASKVVLRRPAGATPAMKTKKTKKTKKIKKKTQVRKPKPPAWIKARPKGCSKCRWAPGCTRSCYLARGEQVP